MRPSSLAGRSSTMRLPWRYTALSTITRPTLALRSPYPRGVATLILLRHGRTSANASGTLAGRTPGVHLDDLGVSQAERAAERLSLVPLAEIVSSPLERCRETARAVAARQGTGHRVRTEKALNECDYGEWQGRSLRDVARLALWKT